MNKEEFVKEINDLGLKITDEIKLMLDKYFKLLVTWNNKFNLTTILEENDVYLKHFYDSICITKAVDLNNYNTLCDFGTGAGFPGIVIAIFFKNLNVTLIESNKKKCSFLEEVKKELNLTNINIVNNRAEIYAKNNREKFDIITCRAVSHLNTLIELAIPMLKINGLFIPLKANATEEIKESENKLKILKSKIVNKLEYYLPLENSLRTIIVIEKQQETNNIYPREYNTIIKDLKKISK